MQESKNPHDSYVIDVFQQLDDNLENLPIFLERFSDQITQAWALTITKNEYAKFKECSKQIVRILDACNRSENSQLLESGDNLIRDIITDHTFEIYRAWGSGRPIASNSMNELLESFARYNHGKSTPLIFSSIDLTVSSIGKILRDVHQRSSFLLFYLTFIENSNPVIVKDLIGHRTIIANWFKSIRSDLVSIVNLTFKVLNKKVLAEREISNLSKLKLFSDFVLTSITPLVKLDDVDQADSFFDAVLDKANGLLQIDRVWSPVISDDHSRDGFSSSQVHNRPVFCIAKALKPWEDKKQMDLLLRIFSNCYELIQPYFSYISESMSFDPKLSMFWVSFITLVIRVQRLPLPPQPSVRTTKDALNLDCVTANIIPGIGRTSLTKCFGSESLLVRYYAAQVTFFALVKLDTILNSSLLTIHEKAILKLRVIPKLPENLLIFSLTSDSDLLSTLYLKIQALYGAIYPESITQPKSIPDFDEIRSGFDLIQMYETLKIQNLSGGVGKWWNKLSQTQHSVFTILLKLSLNDSMQEPASKTLADLALTTLVFQHETIASPAEVLCHSLHVCKIPTPELEKLWNLFDETISRVMRAPYKYIDTISSFTDNKSPVVSVFSLALMEQFKFVEGPKDNIARFVNKFLTDLSTIGEDESIVQKAAKVEKFPWQKVKIGSTSFDYGSKSFLKEKAKNLLQLQALKQAVVKETDSQMIRIYFEYMGSQFIHEMSQRTFWAGLADSNSELIRELYFESLKSNSANIETRGELKSLAKSNLVASGTWLLGAEELKIIANSSGSRLFNSCTERLTFLGAKYDSLEPILDAYKKWGNDVIHEIGRHLHSTKYDDCNLATKLSGDESLDMLAGLVESTGKTTFLKAGNFRECNLGFALAIAHVDPYHDYVRKVCGELFDHLLNPLINSFVCQVMSRKDAKDLISETILKEIFLRSNGHSFIEEDMIKLASLCYKEDINVAQIWFRRLVIWLTQLCSENVEIPQFLLPSLAILQREFDHYQVDVWECIPAANVNSLLEAAFAQHANSEELMNLVAQIIDTGNTSDRLQYTKQLNILLSSSKLRASVAVVHIIYELFQRDTDAHSNPSVARGILPIFSGGINKACDLILLSIIKEIDRHSVSILNFIKEWILVGTNEDIFSNEALFSAVTGQNNNFDVYLQSDVIKRCLNLNKVPLLFTTKPGMSLFDRRTQIERFDFVYPDNIYDFEFLLMACAKITDIQQMVESGALGFVLRCLCDSNKKDIAVPILQNVLVLLEKDWYSEKTAIELLIHKSLATVSQTETSSLLNPCVAIGIGRLSLILSNPAHVLHEQAADFLLKSACLQNELVLFRSICQSESTQIYSEITWLLETLISGLSTPQDFDLYLSQGVFEWAFTHTYYSHSFEAVKNRVMKLVEAAEIIPGCAGVLAARTGALQWIQQYGTVKQVAKFTMTGGEELNHHTKGYDCIGLAAAVSVSET